MQNHFDPHPGFSFSTRRARKKENAATLNSACPLSPMFHVSLCADSVLPPLLSSDASPRQLAIINCRWCAVKTWLAGRHRRPWCGRLGCLNTGFRCPSNNSFRFDGTSFSPQPHLHVGAASKIRSTNPLGRVDPHNEDGSPEPMSRCCRTCA